MAKIVGRDPWICLGMCLWGACAFNTDNRAFVDDPLDGADASSSDGASGSDGAPTDAPLACPGDTIPFALLNVESCDLPASTGDLNLTENGNYLIDTDTGSLQAPSLSTQTLDFGIVAQEDGSELFVVTQDNLEIGGQARVSVIGSRPLVIVSLGDIQIDGVLAARGTDQLSGAGGNLDVACALGRGTSGSTQLDENDNGGGSGGGGGAFAASAGTGAKVDTSGGSESAAGEAALDLDLVPLRGGCAGGKGGDALGGTGGHAGGAIQLVAGGTVRIDGVLSASGGGGAGASVHGGGGGGGSGGGLLVQATSVIVSGAVTANGGGGGEGSRSNDASPGADGSPDSAVVAGGGNGQSEGGDGGDGGALGQAAEDGEEGSLSSPNAAGGGGGGGSVGAIRFSALTIDLQGSSVISPSAQVPAS